MYSVFDDVGKRLKKKLVTETDAPYHSSGLSCTSKDVSVSPPSYPCLYVRGLDEGTKGTDLENNQCYINSVIELQSFSSVAEGSQTKARKIIDYAGDVMFSMGYQLMGGFPFNDNTSDYYRTIARFQRIVGNGESLY